MTHIIAFVNNKGGVGKTTSVVNLGHALALRKKKVLVVDMDSQCNATSIFLKDGATGNTLYELYNETPPLNVASCLCPTDYENLWLLPNALETANMESTLITAPDKGYFLLREKLKDSTCAQFDYILLDCPPNLGLFAVQAMVTASSIVIPIECGSRFAIDGMKNTMNAIHAVQQHFDVSIRSVRLLISRVDKRTRISRVTTQQIRTLFGDDVFDTVVPINTTVQQAELLRQTVIDYAPESNGAQYFHVLAGEIERSLA